MIPPAELLVYTVDQNNTFSSFQPGPNPAFHDIGTLNCNDPGGGTPFSMSVDRNGVAWVIFSSGNLFNVYIADAGCEPTDYVSGQQGLLTFGMGFATQGPGSTQDTLYIAGAPPAGSGAMAPAELAILDTGTLNVSVVAPVGGDPELTGTGSGQLWGFFPQVSLPGTDAGDAFIVGIDPVTGNLGTPILLPDLDGAPSAWAFAYYGGDFWVFLALQNPDGTQGVTNVWHVNGTTGSATIALPTNRSIVGAGESTFVPTFP